MFSRHNLSIGGPIVFWAGLGLTLLVLTSVTAQAAVSSANIPLDSTFYRYLAKLGGAGRIPSAMAGSISATGT